MSREESDGGEITKTLHRVRGGLVRLLKAALAAAAALIVSSYLLALPLGLELFLLEGLSPEYSPDSLLSRVMPWIPLPVSLSLVFSSLTGVYTLCFLAAWMWGDPFHRAVVGVPFRPWA